MKRRGFLGLLFGAPAAAVAAPAISKAAEKFAETAKAIDVPPIADPEKYGAHTYYDWSACATRVSAVTSVEVSEMLKAYRR